MIVFLLFFVTVGVIYAKPHGSAAMEKGNKERKIETVVMQRQHASSNMSGENVAILLQNDDEGCYRKSTKGSDYRGNVQVTESGRTCQNWVAAKGYYTPSKMAYAIYDLSKNYCRNPSWKSIGQRPWCYTGKPKPNHWEYCNIPACAGKSHPWREDLLCGPNYPINGTAAECNPDGGYPCCGIGVAHLGVALVHWCGKKTDKHCKCEDCIDYSTAPWPSVTGHCLRDPWKTTYPCDHGHRVGCDKEGIIWKGYCWRSCIRSGLMAAHINVWWRDEDIGYEYPRNTKWEYLPCTTDMECIEKRAGLWHGGKRCYTRGIKAPLEENKN